MYNIWDIISLGRDLNNTREITKPARMPPPTDLTETRKFLGFVGYYRKFIPKYSDIARPLTNLTRKDIPFEWSKACQAAFEMLKEYLLKEPILKYPNLTNPIYCTQMQVNMLGLACSPKPMCTRKRKGIFPFITLSPMLVVFLRAPS